VTDPTARLAAALGDRYRIERELGAGGMATVYLAQDTGHGCEPVISGPARPCPVLAERHGTERPLVEVKVPLDR